MAQVGSSSSPTPSADVAPATMKAAHTETDEPAAAPSIKSSASAAASETQDPALPVPVTSPRSTPPVTEKIDDTVPTQIIQTDIVDLSKPTVPPSTAARLVKQKPQSRSMSFHRCLLISAAHVHNACGAESAPSSPPESVATTPTDGLGSELPPLPSNLSQRCKSRCRNTGIATHFEPTTRTCDTSLY